MAKSISISNKIDINPIHLTLLILGIVFLGFLLTINVDLISALLCIICIVGATFLAQFVVGKWVSSINKLKPIHHYLFPVRFFLELGVSLVTTYVAFSLLASFYQEISFPDLEVGLLFLSKVQIILSILTSQFLMYIYKFSTSGENYYPEAAIASILCGALLTFGEQDIFYNTNEYLTELLFYAFFMACTWAIFQYIREIFERDSTHFLLKRGFLFISLIIPLDILFNYLFLKFTYDIPLYKDYWYIEIPFKVIALLAINFAEGLSSNRDTRATPASLKVKSGDKVNIVPFQDIAYFHVEDGINYLHTNNHKKFIVDDSLNNLVGMLNEDLFFRANRQLIISKSAIVSYRSADHKKIKINLKGCADDFIISRVTAPDFRKWMA